jgi:hypothetical protein
MLSVIMLSVAFFMFMLSVTMLSVIILTVFMLIVIMLSVVMLTVFMLIVVAPGGGIHSDRRGIKRLSKCMTQVSGEKSSNSFTLPGSNVIKHFTNVIYGFL